MLTHDDTELERAVTPLYVPEGCALYCSCIRCTNPGLKVFQGEFKSRSAPSEEQLTCLFVRPVNLHLIGCERGEQLFLVISRFGTEQMP